jgi:hypothetical protein
VEQILAAVDELAPDVSVLGCHRGGPAGVIEAGSTARQVIHAAPCVVLTGTTLGARRPATAGPFSLAFGDRQAHLAYCSASS